MLVKLIRYEALCIHLSLIKGWGGRSHYRHKNGGHNASICNILKDARAKEGANPYTTELSAINQALRCLSDQIQGRNIYINTRGLSAVQGLMQPKQQSGQMDIKAIYQAAEKLLQQGNQIQCIRLPTKVTSQQQTAAKKAARDPTRQEAPLKLSPYQARPTTTRRAIEAMKKSHTLPRKVGDFTTKLNRALPGKHTKKLYDSLKKTEAKILIQLHMAMGRNNE